MAQRSCPHHAQDDDDVDDDEGADGDDDDADDDTRDDDADADADGDGDVHHRVSAAIMRMDDAAQPQALGAERDMSGSEPDRVRSDVQQLRGLARPLGARARVREQVRVLGRHAGASADHRRRDSEDERSV
eukprot:879500-Rhodomonas_salina.1